MSQPDFARGLRQGNVIFRIPTPVFGAGLIEAIDEATILANARTNARQKIALGITGFPNRSGNDGTITRFGWKAQNKSLQIFSGEAYNVEVGVTNEMFPNERGGAPSSCLYNSTPEDTSNFLPQGSDVTQVPSDIVAFSTFMRFLDQPTPAGGQGHGAALFSQVGCALCHTPSMTTGTSTFAPAALSGVQANLFSDLLVHDMGQGLADGISQGLAGGSEFRTAPLWGIGQRVFFNHDGRCTDLVCAIQAHQSRGSEANQVIQNFNQLSPQDQQSILYFLRSL